jgi:hypothetical protein
MTYQFFDEAEDLLLTIADHLVSQQYRHHSRLHRALVLDLLAGLAGDLRHDDVRSVRPALTWRQTGEAFGVTQQAASKRWGG